MDGQKKIALIVGAGPAGLTAAYELLTRTDIRPIVFEKSQDIGGLSRTCSYRGNRIDIGGHRFFSKSDRVMNWWASHLPPEVALDAAPGHPLSERSSAPPAEAARSQAQECMLIRTRRSRIYFLRKLFSYPISLSVDTVRKLGARRFLRIGFGYVRIRMFPLRKEENLEHFFINRFGKELYLTFFKSYTEKVWGVPCSEISAEWGAQRIKGLSIAKAVKHALCKIVRPSATRDHRQKGVETSLIEKFLYPRFGPGQMWETVAEKIVERGGLILKGQDVVAIASIGDRVTGLTVRDRTRGTHETFAGDRIFSTMPIKDLARAWGTSLPETVRQVTEGLMYRDFITIGVLVERLTLKDPSSKGTIKDNWIYIQEPDVLLGRLQIFNNWSPDLVADPSKIWLGLEYFCNEGDRLWSRSDDELKALAKSELHLLGIADKADVLDSTVIRVEKAYPSYFGTYNRFSKVKEFFNGFGNLHLIGRNGMHKYNNQDHSMLTAMKVVDALVAGHSTADVWGVNTEQDYHEQGREKTPVSAS